MQTLCKPSRRVYDIKVIEACHDDPKDDDHDDWHRSTSVALSGTAAAVASRIPGGGSFVAEFVKGTFAAAFVAEVEETVAHGLESLADAAEDLWDSATSSGNSAGGGGTVGGPSPPMNDDGTFGSLAPCTAAGATIRILALWGCGPKTSAPYVREGLLKISNSNTFPDIEIFYDYNPYRRDRLSNSVPKTVHGWPRLVAVRCLCAPLRLSSYESTRIGACHSGNIGACLYRGYHLGSRLRTDAIPDRMHRCSWMRKRSQYARI